MVCKKDTNGLYWFGPKNALRPVGEVKLVLSCTEVLVGGVTSRRERDVFPDLKMRVKCVCNSAGALARSRRVVCLCVRVFFSLERSLHAPFIVSRRCKVTRYWYVA
jgi:hypothetical protein